MYIQYPFSQSPYRNYIAINSNLKIVDQEQGMSWFIFQKGPVNSWESSSKSKNVQSKNK